MAHFQGKRALSEHHCGKNFMNKSEETLKPKVWDIEAPLTEEIEKMKKSLSGAGPMVEQRKKKARNAAGLQT